MIEFIQHVVNGVAVGCMYGLVALGFVLVYKATELVNFAQGDLLMLGAFVAYTLIAAMGFPYWLGFLGAVILLMLLGALIDVAVFRPVLGQPQFTLVMLTIGLGYVIRAVVSMMPGWGVQPHSFPTPFTNRVVSLGGVVLSQEHLSMIVGTMVVCGALALLFRMTRTGVAMQAASQNQLAAYCMGIPVRFIFTMIFAVGAGIATIAGVLLSPISLVDANLGFIVLKAFPAAVLGGFGSIPGAVLGGVVIGLIEQFTGLYLSDSLKNISPYVVLLLVLVFRPEGLLGRPEHRKV
jgi:branched-chain amino acid transport system permease protein